MSLDTIAAIATPPGTGGVGIVRVSGSAASAIALQLIGKRPRARYATFATFSDQQGDPIDQGIALFFQGPASFTGEDVLELQGHGGPVVLDMLVSRCLQLGARLARPGEFSERAYLNGKLDLTQAEAIADLVESSTTLSARLAVRSLQGAFASRIDSAVDDLIHLRTLLETSLDFPEEDLDVQTHDQFQTRIQDIAKKVADILTEARHGERIRNGLTVLIAGRPNAGKSSLLNALVQSDAAIVTTVPGTTRDLLPYDIELEGLPVRVIDTAGIHDTYEPVEQEGIRRARHQMAQSDLVLWVYDCNLGIGPSELDGLPSGVPVTLVRNKVDIAYSPQASYASGQLPEIDVSALTGLGLNDLRRHIRMHAGLGQVGESSFVARRRHLDALERSLRAIHNAGTLLASGAGAEIAALDITLAQRALGEITGDFTSEDLLNRIFSSFCIGK